MYPWKRFEGERVQPEANIALKATNTVTPHSFTDHIEKVFVFMTVKRRLKGSAEQQGGRSHRKRGKSQKEQQVTADGH